ncbi:hypothetical protein Fleli_2537 [Bernardetia litoralis DSM 6794]|uniref:Uncharacterized protein n=1 Tax=Bernardetia litoralis (strain ATCC 23117 / DSM 6794 / NBRC 15988 / NCIMB 1366 / Fx l1 / Sio-4) TaxID=880071 RepID=I4ALR7_BERLS|nr:hypothetical protein [Bernardetia litoralis]AFM04902.1 hypothetical protein Fleli_2537 [Bernardetia litoralis DSM 6794]
MDNNKNNLSANNFNSEFDANSDLDILFKEALQNHAVPAEDHVWRRIQHGLADKQNEKVVPISKRSYLPIWSAVTGIAASLLIWAVFFNSSDSINSITHSTTIANSSQIEIKKELNNSKNRIALHSDIKNGINNSEKNQEIQKIDATSSTLIASKKQQIPPTITIKRAVSKNQNVKGINTQNHIDRAVASLEKDQTKIKNQSIKGKMDDKKFINPSTHISQNVWASDFVVQSSDISPSLKKEKNSEDIHQLNLDNQTVAITIKVGRNGNSNYTTSQATGFDTYQNASQFDKAKTVLKEVWNLKSGKKVNLQNILPNNENETTTIKKTTTQSSANNEIQAD